MNTGVPLKTQFLVVILCSGYYVSPAAKVLGLILRRNIAKMTDNLLVTIVSIM